MRKALEFPRIDEGKLDAVEALTLPAQRALLHLLQEHEVTRMGADDPVRADVRIIAASGANLEELAAKGEFLPDLLARLELSSLHVPPAFFPSLPFFLLFFQLFFHHF